MRNYYQIKTVASAPPRRQIQAGKVICVSGFIFTLGSPFIAWLLSVGVNRVPSFPLIFFGLFLFLDGLLIILIASKQQEVLLKLRQSLLEDDPQIVASAEEFMAQRKALTQQGEITGIFIVHNATKDLYYVGQSALIAAGTKQGVCCFYLNGNDREGHKKILSYMLDNGLVRKTKSGKLYNISFKYDTETYAGKYKGSGFSGKIKLADFVNLETGEFI